MKSTSGSLKRLILGLSVEDAQSKFDTTANRKLLLHSHERHNLGVLHELQLAQRKREALSPERKCFIVRFAKPTVRGFQAYIKDKPDDYVIREVWEDEEKQQQQAQEEEDTQKEEWKEANRMLLANDNSKRNKNENTTSIAVDADNTATSTTNAASKSTKPNSRSALEEEEQEEQQFKERNSEREKALLPVTSAIAPKLNAERQLFHKQRELMLETLAAALDNVADNVLSELTERRQSGIIVNGGSAQLSVVDKLVGEVSAAEEQGYKSLSSSTHLLDPVEMTLTLFSRKDKDIAEAFRTNLLTVPAKEGCISYSLWVAGGLIADSRLCSEFPFHIAKYVVPEEVEQEQEELLNEEEGEAIKASDAMEQQQQEEGEEEDRHEMNVAQQSEKDKKRTKHVNPKKESNNTTSDNNNNTSKSKAAHHQRHGHYYLPRVDVEVYFSPELYRLQRLLGSSGLTQLRQFIGMMMMKQHEPTTTSASLLLNSESHDRLMYYGYEGEANEGVVIPWVQEREVKLSAVTGVVFSSRQVESRDESAPIKKREAVLLVWKTWGHLIKDLHVHGDLDFLYVAIDRHKEVKESADYIDEVKKTLSSDNSNMLSSVAMTTNQTSIMTNTLRTSNVLHPDRGKAKRRHMYIPLSTDFAVVECVLERKGLPHNMVMEDITSALTEMQSSQADMLRLSVLDRIMEERQEEGLDGKKYNSKREEINEHEPVITPVLYTPKVVVSHAGVLENNTHSFQKIRIRGSSLAHVESLASALSDGSFFTNRSVYSSVLSGKSTSNNNIRMNKKESMSMTNSLLDLHHLPANGSFTATHNAQLVSASTQRRLVGHRLGCHGQLDQIAQRSDANRFASTQRIQSHKHMLIDETERAFWHENFYRLHSVQLIFHDRVDAQDTMMQQDALSPRLQSYLRSLTSGLSGNEENDNEEKLQISESSSSNHNNKMTKLKARRRRTRKHVEPGKVSMEKMYEYLCTDVEATTAEFDLHVGQCKNYFYELCLRRIPQHDAPYIVPALHTLNTKGFINYFGSSRFGSYTQFNMHPGLHLLKNEFRAAAQVLVQQYYIDAALAAERKRTGCTFPSLLSLNNGLANIGGNSGNGYRLMDIIKGAGRKSVNENGTPIQRVLHNALQAAALIYGDESIDSENSLLDVNNSSTKRSLLHNAQHYSDPSRQGMSKMAHKNKLVRSTNNKENTNLGTNSNNTSTFLTSLPTAMLDDPCAEAFLNVIGPRACQILIQEFLAFVWNDIVNQRLQRYGTFAILPGDLVKERPSVKTKNGTCIDGVVLEHELHCVSRRDIERGLYTHWDVILPIPGAHVILPENHTADLYVVTLKRYGLNFNPELKQWGCFYPHGSSSNHDYEKGDKEVINPKYNVKQQTLVNSSGNNSNNAIHKFSPYRSLTPSFQLMEEELSRSTPFTEVISHMYGESSHNLIKTPVASSQIAMNAREQRRDLRLQNGNYLGLTISTSYRHPLINPSSTLQWHFDGGKSEDPFQRWGTALRRVFPSLKQIPALPLTAQQQNANNVSKANNNTSSNNIIWSDESSELPQSTVHLLQESSKKIDKISKEFTEHNSNNSYSNNINENSDNNTSSDKCSVSNLTCSTVSRSGVIPFLAPAPIQTLSSSSSSSSLMFDENEGNNEISTNAKSNNELSQRRRGASLPLPATPYWLPKHNNGCLRLRFTFPAGVYPRMMLRELTKSDVNVSDVVDVNRPVVDRRAKSFASLSREQQETFKRYLARNRQIKFDRPSHAVQLALLHQHIFRSGGVRHSLLPTMRSYDSLVK